MKAKKIVLILSSLFLVGCGADKSAMTALSSRSAGGTPGFAECNRFTTSGLAGILATDEQPETIRVRLTSVSADFANSSRNLNLSFQGYGYQSDGSLVRTAQPFPINFQYKGDGKNILTSNLLAMNAGTFTGLQEKLKTTYGIGTSTVAEAMKYFDVVVTAVDLRFDVIQVTVTEGAATTPTWSDVLPPAFEANPDVYAGSHPEVLVKLHPFASTRGSGKPESTYLAQADAYCRP